MNRTVTNTQTQNMVKATKEKKENQPTHMKWCAVVVTVFRFSLPSDSHSDHKYTVTLVCTNKPKSE